MAKPGNPGTGKHWKTTDFKGVIMTDQRIDESMGQKWPDRPNGTAVTDYSKKKEE